MLAYDFPLLGLFWTILWIYLVVAWLIILFNVILDVIRNRDLSGVAKAMWLALTCFLPFIGVLAYAVLHGDEMAARYVARRAAKDEEARAYVQSTVASTGTADQIEQLARLRDDGTITDAEFESGKQKILA
jgi:phosphoglycerol transferase MdoB-like AlkP superfamily enzyme